MLLGISKVSHLNLFLTPTDSLVQFWTIPNPTSPKEIGTYYEGFQISEGKHI